MCNVLPSQQSSVNPDDKFIGSLFPNPNDPSWYRADGTLKGPGHLGMMANRGNPGYSSGEISVGATPQELGPHSPAPGPEGYVDIPSMVPGLDRNQLSYLLDTRTQDLGRNNPRLMGSIEDKARSFAQQRLAQGKSVFASPEESPIADPRFLVRPTLATP